MLRRSPLGGQITHRVLVTLIVCLCLIFAGVLFVLFSGIGGPSPDRPVPVIVGNDANITHSFEIWVVKYPGNMTIRRSDGRIVNGSGGPGLVNTNSGPHHYLSIEFTDSARLHTRQRLVPGEENTSYVKNFSSEKMVFVLVYEGDQKIISYVSAHCKSHLIGLEVHSYPTPPGGVWAGYQCW